MNEEAKISPRDFCIALTAIAALPPAVSVVRIGQLAQWNPIGGGHWVSRANLDAASLHLRRQMFRGEFNLFLSAAEASEILSTQDAFRGYITCTLAWTERKQNPPFRAQ